MESCGDKSVTSPITLKKTVLVPATPSLEIPHTSHHMTTTSKGERKDIKERGKVGKVLAQAVQNPRLI